MRSPNPLKLELEIPPAFHLPYAAHNNPKAIDQLLLPHLLSPTLPIDLHSAVEDQVRKCVTPELSWGGDPTRPSHYWVAALVHGTLIGRAYALLSPPPPQSSASSLYLTDPNSLPFSKLPTELRLDIFEAYLAEWKQRQNLWNKTIMPIFIKAFFSGSVEPGARYVAAVIFLTCGDALSKTQKLLGRGKRWVWYDDRIADDRVWDWEELKTAFMDTINLPRENHDVEAIKKRDGKWWREEYVPQEVLDSLDMGREKVGEGGRDWTSEEVVERCWRSGWDLKQAARDWVEGIVEDQDT